MHAVYHVVYDGPDPGDPPSQDKLDDWITTYELVNNVLVPDEPDHAEEAFDRRECTYLVQTCLLYTSPSPRDGLLSRMPSSA